MHSLRPFPWCQRESTRKARVRPTCRFPQPGSGRPFTASYLTLGTLPSYLTSISYLRVRSQKIGEFRSKAYPRNGRSP